MAKRWHRAAGRLAHQIGLVAELHRERKQRADARSTSSSERDAQSAQQVVLGNAELRILAQLLAQVLRRAVEEMRRPPAKFSGSPSAADQRPIDICSIMRSNAQLAPAPAD